MSLEKYKNPLTHTSQFVMCGNCFRMDTYKGCSFGCTYCFANYRPWLTKQVQQVSDINLVRKWFYEALELNDTSNIKKEMLNRRVPIHLGGMADPFQTLEWEYGATYEFLKLTKEYNYPVNMSTKTAHLPDKYWGVLDPNIHTFSISLLGYSDDYVKKWETNTPMATERIKFIEELKSRGFWVSIRIQPIIDIDEVLLLIKNSEHLVDFYTVEHLKIPMNNPKMAKLVLGKLENPTLLKPFEGEWWFDPKDKIKNIERIKESTKVKIGCGDDDLHIMSDTLNCCGIDTMPSAFENWYKYNSMYIKLTGDRSQWSPQNNCTSCLNSKCVVKGMKTMKEYTDRYYLKHYGDDNQLTLF